MKIYRLFVEGTCDTHFLPLGVAYMDITKNSVSSEQIHSTKYHVTEMLNKNNVEVSIPCENVCIGIAKDIS